MTINNKTLLKRAKKGFTLTELAIVIAVIAILIAVLVPTFTSIITSARRTTAAEMAKNAITEYYIETFENLPDGAVVKVTDGDNTYYWVVENGSFEVKENLSDTEVSALTLVQYYAWGEDGADYDGKVVLYVKNTYITTSAIATTIAQRAVDAYVAKDSTNNAGKVQYASLTGANSTTYYFSVASDTVTADTSNSTPSSNVTTDTSTWTGVTLSVSSS